MLGLERRRHRLDARRTGPPREPAGRQNRALLVVVSASASVGRDSGSRLTGRSHSGVVDGTLASIGLGWLPEATRRSGRRVALLARYPDRDPAMPQFIPNLGLYMVEAALRKSGLPDLEIKVWDIAGGDGNSARVAAEVIAF